MIVFPNDDGDGNDDLSCSFLLSLQAEEDGVACVENIAGSQLRCISATFPSCFHCCIGSTVQCSLPC